MARRSNKNRLQEELQEKRQKLKRRAMFALMLLAGVAAVSALYLKLIDKDTLPVRVVKIDGDFNYLDTQALKSLLSQQLNRNFLSIDIDGIQHHVKKVPWVDRVSIRRKWPDTLLLQISEQQPLAKWGKGGLVNQRGEWFAAGESSAIENLPELDGPDGTVTMLSDEYLDLNEKLKPLGLKTIRLSMSHRRSWKLDLGNGLTLHLGRMKVHERLQRFLKIYQQIIAGQLEKIESVDMRYTNGFAVRWKPGSDVQDNNNKGVKKDV